MTHPFDDSQANRFALSELNEDIAPFDRDDEAFDVAPSRRAKNLAGSNVKLRPVQSVYLQPKQGSATTCVISVLLRFRYDQPGSWQCSTGTLCSQAMSSLDVSKAWAIFSRSLGLGVHWPR